MALCSVHVLAQGTEPINTDRPDQSDGTYILPTKMIQIESGIIFSQTDRQLSDIIQTSMLRYGIAKKWELRLLTNEGFSGIPVIAKNSFGFYPITLSAKHALVDQKGMIPGTVRQTWHGAHRDDGNLILPWPRNHRPQPRAGHDPMATDTVHVDVPQCRNGNRLLQAPDQSRG